MPADGRDNGRVRAPPITVTCDCGEVHRLPYGARLECGCGRSYDTEQIPATDYASIVAVDRRFRRFGWVGFGALALLFLFFILTNAGLLLIVVPASLMTWFIYIRPVVRRRHRRAVAELTKRWELRPEGGR